jgi:hypothetical protein
LQLKLDQCPHPQRTFDILTWSHHCIVVGFHPDSGCMMSRLHFTCLYIEIQQLNEHFREPCSLCVFLCESWVFFVKINFIFSLGLWYLYAWFCSLSYVMWTWVVAFFCVDHLTLFSWCVMGFVLICLKGLYKIPALVMLSCQCCFDEINVLDLFSGILVVDNIMNFLMNIIVNFV